MAYRDIDNIIIENATILWPNFSGKEGMYNAAGARSVCVVIPDPIQAQQLAEDGWNVRILQPRNEDEEALSYIKAAIRFDPVPPRIFMVTRRNKIRLDEESISNLDYAEIKNVDIVITPYKWERDRRSGIKAYVKEMYVTIEEDTFADKYADYADH